MWLWILICAILFWIPQNALHEGSHALMAKCFGQKIIKFWPIPGKLHGKWMFAYVQYYGKKLFGWPKRLVTAAPQLLNVILLSILSILAIYFEHPVIYALIITNTADLAANLFFGLVFGRGDVGKLIDSFK